MSTRLIDEAVLSKIQQSNVPFNPIDSDSPEIRYAFRKAFDKLLTKELDWHSIQAEAALLRRVIQDQQRDAKEAREATRIIPPYVPFDRSVPVIIDAIRDRGLVRANYFCIESDVPRPGWQLTLDESSFSFLLIGLTGIILHPVDGLRFESPQLIEKTFNRLEDELGFAIAIGDLWLPSQVFRTEATSGSVFRLDSGSFVTAYSMRETYFSIDTENRPHPWGGILERLGKFPAPEFSEMETVAFAGWSDQQIRAAEERYPKDRELALVDEVE